MPKTSESISILAVYLTVLLSLSTASVVSSGVVMNMPNKSPETPVPDYLKCLLCCRRRSRRKKCAEVRDLDLTVSRGQSRAISDLKHNGGHKYWLVNGEFIQQDHTMRENHQTLMKRRELSAETKAFEGNQETKTDERFT